MNDTLCNHVNNLLLHRFPTLLCFHKDNESLNHIYMDAELLIKQNQK